MLNAIPQHHRQMAARVLASTLPLLPAGECDWMRLVNLRLLEPQENTELTMQLYTKLVFCGENPNGRYNIDLGTAVAAKSLATPFLSCRSAERDFCRAAPKKVKFTIKSACSKAST